MLDGVGTSHTVSGNVIHDNTANGIKLAMWTATSSSTISGNTVYANGGSGISLNTDCASNIVSGNIVYGNGLTVADRAGIDLFKVGNGNIIRYNIVHDQHYVSVDSGGIRFDGDASVAFGSGNLAYYNVVYNERYGLHALNTPNGGAFYNNTIYNSTVYGIMLDGASANGVIVKNNIVHTAGTSLIYNHDSINSVIDYNCYYPATGTLFNWNGTSYNFTNWKSNSSKDANSLNVDPLFVSTVTPDFQLQAGSPCINAGVDVGLTLDYAGGSIVGVPDMGAYEYSGYIRLIWTR